VRGHASQAERFQKQRRRQKLQARLAELANRPLTRYRLTHPVRFRNRVEEWREQVASGAVSEVIRPAERAGVGAAGGGTGETLFRNGMCFAEAARLPVMVTAMRIVANILRVLFILGALCLLAVSGGAAILDGIPNRQEVVLASALGAITSALLAVAATNNVGRRIRPLPDPPAVPIQPRYQTHGAPPAASDFDGD
jgi:hypothetical protein